MDRYNSKQNHKQSLFTLTCLETKQDRGPIWVNIPTLLTFVTMASKTSPLKGLNTIACVCMYVCVCCMCYVHVCVFDSECNLVFDGIETEAAPWLQCAQSYVVNGSHRYHKTIPAIEGVCVCVREREGIYTYFPVQVPSTSVKSFFLTVSSRLGPKYLGCSRIS